MNDEPSMSRSSDGDESRDHERSLDKVTLTRRIVGRLADGSRQKYTTLCQFGQEGGPATLRTLLTHAERQGYVEQDGKIGAAKAFRITDSGRSWLAS